MMLKRYCKATLNVYFYFKKIIQKLLSIQHTILVKPKLYYLTCKSCLKF